MLEEEEGVHRSKFEFTQAKTGLTWKKYRGKILLFDPWARDAQQR